MFLVWTDEAVRQGVLGLMNIRSFLKLVEIQTKVASVIPFLLGTSYALYRFGAFKPLNFLLMLASLLCFDMTTTAVNNYLDFKRANRKFGYGYESHNAIVKDKLSERSVLAVIGTLLAVAVVAGFVLFLNTDIIVLLLGVVSFMIGLLYSAGPVPISRTPFGELFSGGFMGLVIPFLSAYIHIYDRNLFDLGLSDGMLRISVNLPELIFLLLISLPAAAGIANIMLANNICDIEDDLENKRYTLPIYTGKKNALIIFELLYYTGYAALAVLLVLGAAPLLCILAFLTLIPVYKNIRLFKALQTKKDTFVLSVKNFVVSNGVLVITVAAAAALKIIG